MRKSIEILKHELQSDIAVFHHVDGCYSTIGALPKGAEEGSVCFTEDGSRLLVKDVARLTDEPRHFAYGFLTQDGSITCESPKPKTDVYEGITQAVKAKKKTKKVNDEVVGSMTEEPNQ
jgi:hypothetical protein